VPERADERGHGVGKPSGGEGRRTMTSTTSTNSRRYRPKFPRSRTAIDLSSLKRFSPLPIYRERLMGRPPDARTPVRGTAGKIPGPREWRRGPGGGDRPLFPVGRRAGFPGRARSALKQGTPRSAHGLFSFGGRFMFSKEIRRMGFSEAGGCSTLARHALARWMHTPRDAPIWPAARPQMATAPRERS